MIIEESIKNILQKNKDISEMYLRNLIKEELQGFVLNFVYNSTEYQKLMFTGGTCLRKVYGLNRLSEDLDFDYVADVGFDINSFSAKIRDYFMTTLSYENITVKIAENKRSIFLKMPILKQLRVFPNRTPEDLFLRCDFSEVRVGGYVLEKNTITAGSFQFFVSNYDLTTMFANKLVAFLERSFFKGSEQLMPFKGRDVYDIFWLIQLSAKSSYKLRPNKERLSLLLANVTKVENISVDNFPQKIKEKVNLLDDKYVLEDIRSLIESSEYINGFMGSYREYILKNIDFVLS